MHIHALGTQWLGGLAFTPDGRQLVAVGTTEAPSQPSRDSARIQVRVRDLASGAEAGPPLNETVADVWPALAADGSRVACVFSGHGGDHVRVWGRTDGFD